MSSIDKQEEKNTQEMNSMDLQEEAVIPEEEGSVPECQEPRAVQGTAILCFAAVIIGEAFLLRRLFPMPFFREIHLILSFISWIVLAAGIVYLWTHEKGWGTLRSKIVVFSLFGLCILYSVCFYSRFVESYLTGWDTDAVIAGAMVGVRLVLMLIGITAGIPVGPKIDDREYAYRLREKALQQEARWAKESVKGAKRDLAGTVERLRNSLTREELQALLDELQTPVSVPGMDNQKDSSSEDDGSADMAAAGITTEDLKGGWGKGI